MKIIRNYLLKEMFPPFMLALLISTMILTASNIIQMADFILNKGVNVFHMIKLVAYMMPSLLMFTIPISVLSSILLGFARLTSDNEIIALKASGVSLLRISFPVITAGMMLSLLCIPLNYQVMPESGYRARKLVKEIGVQNPAALLEPGLFLKIFEDYIIFIYDMKGNELKNVRIYQPQKDGPTRTLIAEKGLIIPQPNKNTIKIKLTNGMADEINPDDPKAFYKLVFKNYYISLDLKESFRKQNVEKKTRELTLYELKNAIAKNESKGIDNTPFYIELHNKVALAFSSLIFILIAIPIGVKTHRREKSINFGMALVVFMVYWAVMLAGVACAIRKFIPVWLGVWSPNIIFGIIGLYLFRKVLKR